MTNLKRKLIVSRLKEAAASMKIRTKLFWLIMISAITCLLLFRFLWMQKLHVWGMLVDDFPIQLGIFPTLEDSFYNQLEQEALKYNIPESEDDEEAVEAMRPFLELADDYTAIYIYGIEDGLYRCGHFPNMMDERTLRTFFDIGYRWTDGAGEQTEVFTLQFKNGHAAVHLAFYHRSFFLFPYFFFCLVFCIVLFLSVILFFVTKKMESVISLKETILRMSSGDLTTPVRFTGQDEIGILARELDCLRRTLLENLKEEQQMHKSNQQLIAALSHDLRTPLTILKGYLEILHLNRNAQMQAQYIQRCMQKADDIQEMTDRMFEYALVFDVKNAGIEQVHLEQVPLAYVRSSLKEHDDFLRLAGFQTEFHSCFAADSGDCMQADAAMLKRVLNNLFSNIIKYADKKETVVILAEQKQDLIIAVKNKMKSGNDHVESTQIGLKSVQKMMELMEGELLLDTDGHNFTAKLRFSCGKILT